MAFWNKYKPKPVETVKNQLYRNYFLTSLGSTIINWKNLYTDKQNNGQLLDYYNDIAEVSIPINYYADSAKQVNFEVFKKSNGKLILMESHWITDLLNKPNFYQTAEQYKSQRIINLLLFGNNYMSGLVGPSVTGGKKPTALFNMPPQYAMIQLKQNVNDFRLAEIDKYVFKHGNKNAITVDAVNMSHTKLTNPNFDNNQYLFGTSSLVSCEKPIESIASGYSAKVGLYKHGPRVIITGKSSSLGDIGTQLGDDNIKDVRDRFNKDYGLTEDQFQLLITDIPLDVKQITNSVQSLAIGDNNREDFERICGALQIPSLILSDNSHSTFNNVQEAKSFFYNGAFITLMDTEAKALTEYFNRFESDIIIKADYSGIDEIIKAQNLRNKELFEDCKAGMITRNQYLEEIGRETVDKPEFNEYYFYTAGGWVPVTNTNNNGASN